MAYTGGIEVYIKANTLEFNRKMASANKQLQSFGATARTVSKDTALIGTTATVATQKALTGAARLEKAWKRVRTVMVSVGVSLATIAALAGMAKLVTAAAEFETAFAGVQKTVDATATELATLRNEIRQMAKEIPLTTTELSKIGEVGGQLGISVQNMGRFIDIIAKLGVATTMTIDDAAMSVARFAAIMRTSEEDYERLASTLVHLGNNFAATEQEIMTMGLRIAGAGKQVGMTEDQVLSLATALTAVGIRAEAGGTAISRTMIEIDKQVAIAGDRLASFAKVAGLGVTEFAQLWEKDAMAALQLFIEGLSRLEARGGNASIVLQELGLGAVRVSDTLRRASSAHELLNETLKFGADGWRENIALQREAEIRFQTSASQFKILINRVMDLAVSVGEELLPPLLSLTKAFVSIIEFTKIWSVALIALKVGALGWLIKTGIPALVAGLVKLRTAYKLTSAGIVIQSKVLAANALIVEGRLAMLTAQHAQQTLLTRGTITHNLALYGNVAANQALAASGAQVTAATATMTAGTKALAAATLTWSAALKTILPLLLLFITYLAVKQLYEWGKALNETKNQQLEAIATVNALNAEVVKQKESLGAVAEAIEVTGSKYRIAAGGHRVFYTSLNETKEVLDKTAEELKKVKEELAALENVLTTGIGTWEQYHTILSNVEDPGSKVVELNRAMVNSFIAQHRAGADYNTIVGQNIDSIKALLFQTLLLGEEGNRYAEVLQMLVAEFDATRYAVDNLDETLAHLTEEQRKLYDSTNATLHPLKKYADELKEIEAINETLTSGKIDVAAWFRANAKSIVDAAKKQREYGIALSDSQLILEATAKSYLKVAGAINKYVDAFKKALNPTKELGEKIRELKSAGYDASTMVRVFGKDVIKTADDARKFNQTVDASVGELEDLARALVPPTHELQKLDFQMISTGDSHENLNRITTQLVPKMGDLQEAFRYLGLEAKHAKAPVDLLAESLEKGWVLQLDKLNMLPGVVAEQIDKMSTAGLNASQIMHLFGGSIKEAAEWLILLDRPLTEAEQGIVDIAATATDTSKIIKKQISTIITDLGKGFADIIVEWQGLWTSLKDIAKDFAKGILRIFFESLFTPIMKGFANVMGGVQGGFTGGFNQAGGFGGISGIFKALGGLFTGGGGGGAAAGGWTNAAEGMTMMDTAATSTSLSLTALTTNFTKLGTTIATSAATAWKFLTAGIAGGPWGLVIAGAAAAAFILWKTVFSKSAYEKFALEFARDFGDIIISDDAIKNFTNSLGVTEEQLAKVRKDVASSPAFLMIGYNAAKAQGKVEQFLTSLESIETAWGTFDFRKAFEEGIDTGNWLDLNEAFVEAFGSDLLKDIFGEDLKGLLIEMDEAMIELVLRTRELHGALETLRNEPVRVAAALTTLVDSIQILRDAGATDAEVMQILGKDMEVVTAAARQLEVAIPPVIQELLALDLATTGLSEAFQEGYAIWGNFIDQGEKLSDTILGLGARMLDVFAPGTAIVGEAIPSIEGLSSAFKDLGSAARTGIGDIPALMENVRMEAEKLKAIVPESVGVLIDAFITQAEATAAGGMALNSFEDAANSMKGSMGGLVDKMIDGLIQQVRYLGTTEEAWTSLETSITSLKESVPESMHPMIDAMFEWAKSIRVANVELEGIDAAIQTVFGHQSIEIIRDVEGVAKAQLMTWSLLGGEVLSLANSYAIVGEELPPVIQLVLDWAIANKHAMESTEGHYIAIGKLSAAYQEGEGIWQNFIDKGWALQDRLMGLGDALLKEYDVVTAQTMAWQFLGDEIISLANSYEGMNRVLPPVIQMALEWAKAAGYIQRNTEGAWEAVEGLTEALSGLNEQQAKGLQAWEDTLTATQELADFMEGWMMGGIGTLGLDVGNVDDAAKMAMLTWNQFGDQVISKANDMIGSGLGEFIDSRTLQMLEWAHAMGLVAKGADGMWKAINQGEGIGADKPYWIQNWEAEMAAIYGSDWKRRLGYETGPAAVDFGGAIPEFPFPDPEDYPISETAELSTRMGELHDVLRTLIGGIQLLADSLRGLGDGVRSVMFDPTAGGLPSNPADSPAIPDTDWIPGDAGGVSPYPFDPTTGGLPGDISSDDRPTIGRPIGSRHFGDDYVSQDMVAMLQKGERVVPANENKPGGYKSSGVNVNITIQGPVYGLDDLDRKIANSVRKTFKAGGLSFLGDS